jgi:hypothetical protein
MKVYIATTGEYSDYQIGHVFARREDAEAYKLGDDVKEMEVHDGPVETRLWHTLIWHAKITDREATSNAQANPHEFSYPQDYDGCPQYVTHGWPNSPIGAVLTVQGWDLTQVRTVYSEQRAQYLAREEGIS